MVRLYLHGKKGLECLKNINPKYKTSIEEIIIGKDANVKNDYYGEICLLAKKLNLRFFSKNEISDNSKISLSIAIGWRWMISPSKNLIVFHDSLLPKYRGFNPLVTALINGDGELGVTVLEANENFDSGNIIKQKKTSISYPIKIENAIDKISVLYSSLLNEVLGDFFGEGLESFKQDEEMATYSLWRDEKDYEIDWSMSALKIERFINAVGYPYKGARTWCLGNSVRIFDAIPEEDVVIANRTPGKVLFKKNGCYVIVCGIGLLSVRDFYDDFGNPIVLNNSFRLRFGK